ncbi:MAG: hypothetical protein LBL04_02340 [Bacteroidales bacterium]|jgi:hypothetical protein|nr:hypothetical protein [Bacteroidales bacterium]
MKQILQTTFVLFFILFATWRLSAQSQGESSRQRTEAAGVFAQIEQSGNYTEELSIADLNTLPMGMSRTLSNINYTVAVSSVVTHSDHVQLTVFGRVKLPQSESDGGDKILFFGAQGIKMSYDGNIIGEATLALLGDVDIPVNGGSAVLTLKGNYNPLTGTGTPQTAITMDCRGFKTLSMDALLVFPETLIRPVDGQGKTLPGKVSAGFRTTITNWNDILMGVNLPDFEVVGLDGFTFHCREAIFDFSDLRNDANIRYPEGYREKYLAAGYENLWRGVYIGSLRIDLPPQFASRDSSGKRVGFEARDMILDNNGISGLFSAINVLPIEQGSAGGWRFSVDRFTISLEANHLTGAGFGGSIGLPVAKTDIGYEAFISPANEYFLKVNPVKDLRFDMLNAEARLLPNSYVAMTVRDGRFVPEAMLHGSLTIAARPGRSQDNDSPAVARFDSITFRGMHLQTESPWFSAAQLGYSGEAKIKGFPLSIRDIRLTASGRQVTLSLNTAFAMGVEPFALMADTRLSFTSEMVEDHGRHRWEYGECTMNAITIDASVAEVFSIRGSVTVMNNDPVYGDGFAGELSLTLDKVLSGLGIKARAMFGYKDFRYWMVDGTVSFPAGIPVFPPVNLTGFGGGASYRMKPNGSGSALPTGCAYIPDANTGLGLKAAVLFNAGSDKAINGEAMFEIAFNVHGGVNFIGFFGQAKILAGIPGANDIEKFVGDKFKKIGELEKQFTGNNPELTAQLEKYKLYEPEKAAGMVFEGSEKLGETGFSASLGIKYDFQANSLHANFDLYVNMAGGMLQGASSGNRAGWAVLHIDPDEWYMHMGTPTNPLGIKFNLAGLLRLQTGSYFMMGHRLPGSPPPPPEVAGILGVDAEKLDYMRDLNALGDGRGFAFGSNFKVETGDITFLILYANFKTGLGFDIMLKDYADAQCKGRTGVIGMDGWYANGQAYAYLQGELGVKVNLLFVKKKIPVVRGAAAALMQAKLPNPSWFAGYLGVQFDLLGGLVRGKMRMKIELGEECELVVPGSSPLDVEVIADLSPRNGSQGVDVFSAPQAAFNMRIGQAFEMEDDDGIKIYRLKLEEFSLTEGGKTIAGKEKWNMNSDMVSFYSHEILPPNVSVKAVVRVSFEERRGSNWVTVYTGGKKAEERKEIAFTTGTAPDVIPPHNVEYAYPVFDQYFYYPGESSRGYIQLKRGQSYLFTADMTHRVRLTSVSGTSQTVEFTYNQSSLRIAYAMPETVTGSRYTVEVVSFTQKSGATAGNTDSRTAAVPADEHTDVTVRSAQAGTEIRADAGKTLLKYGFGTSRYRTFADKVNGIQKDKALWGKVHSQAINLQYSIAGGEAFDLSELTGTEYTAGEPLVQVEAVLTDAYFTQSINPLLYRDYPQASGISITNRDTEVLGLPPVKALKVGNSYLTDVERGNFSNMAARYFPYVYDLPSVYYDDFKDLEKQAVNRYRYSPSVALLPLVRENFPSISRGDYRIRLQYVMPGNVKGTQAVFDYHHNPIM